jgi:hypothetical protein
MVDAVSVHVKRPVRRQAWHHHQRLPTLRCQQHVPRKQRRKYL